MAGNGDRLKPLLRPGSPALKRRAIETRTPDQIIWLMTISARLSKELNAGQIIWLMTISAGLSKELNADQIIWLMTISAWLSGSTLN